MSKMRIEIPAWGNIDIENILIDLNGTIATDGKIAPEVKEKINSLSKLAKVYILTADTQGTANTTSHRITKSCSISGNVSSL